MYIQLLDCIANYAYMWLRSSWLSLICRFSDTADGPPPPTGVLAPNNELQKARRLFEGELVGAEAFAADSDGKFFIILDFTYVCLF